MTFWKRQNYGNSKKIRFVGKEGWIGGAQRIFKAVKLFCMILSWWTHVVMHLSKPTECAAPRVNPNVSCGLRVVCHRRFAHCDKCTTWWGCWKFRGLCVPEGENIGELCTFCVILLCTKLLWNIIDCVSLSFNCKHDAWDLSHKDPKEPQWERGRE